MTHTLHRVGSPEELSHDFVVLIMPSQNINTVGSGDKLREMLKICQEKGAVKIGDARLGNQYHQGSVETMLANIEDRAVVQAVFNDEAKLVDALKALKEGEFGMSVVVSGLFDKIKECTHQAGLKRHTVNISLGRWGAVDKLPDHDKMQLQSMCGHGMVAVGLIEDTVAKVKAGKLSPEQGAERLFQPCMCGIFNTDRAAKLLAAMAA